MDLTAVAIFLLGSKSRFNKKNPESTMIILGDGREETFDKDNYHALI